MLDRRQLARNLVAIAMSTHGSSTASVYAFGMEDNLRLELDKQFSQVVRNVAAVRASNRSTAIAVTPLFNALIDMYSLPDFRAYIAGQYKMTRVTDFYGNIEFTDLDDMTLIQFDRRFIPLDRLDINFKYDAEWKTIVEFMAVLRNLVD